MKKTILFVLLLFAINLVSCSPAEVSVDKTDEIENNILSPVIMPSQEDEEKPDIDPQPIQSTEEFDIKPELPLHEVTVDITEAQQIDSSSLYFTETLGSRKTYADSLPEIIGFQYPYVYYERMTAVVKDASPDDAALYVGRYSIETKEKQEFAIDHFTSISDEARLVANENCVVYMYCIFGDDLIMRTEMFDFENNTRQVLAETPAHNVFGYAKKLSENELIFFMYESTPTGAQQTIHLYNMLSENMEEIYRGEDMDGYRDSETSTKDIFAVDTYNEEIYLFMQQYSDNKMHSFIRRIDKQGNVLFEEKIDDLSHYGTLEDTADSMAIKGDYVFIHYSQFNKSSDNTNPPSAVLYHSKDGYKMLDVGEKMKIKTFCGVGSTDVPLAFFRLHDDNETIFACNVQTHEGFLIRLQGEGIVTSRVDSAGNLLIETRVEEKTIWHLLTADEYLGNIGKDQETINTNTELSVADDGNFRIYTVPTDGNTITIRIPNEWYWHDGDFCEDYDVASAFPRVKRVSFRKATETQEEFTAELSDVEEGYRQYEMDDPITGQTDAGYSYIGYYGDDEQIKGLRERRYLFYITTDTNAYVLEMRQHIDHDADNFIEEILHPILKSFKIQ